MYIKFNKNISLKEASTCLNAIKNCHNYGIYIPINDPVQKARKSFIYEISEIRGATYGNKKGKTYILSPRHKERAQESYILDDGGIYHFRSNLWLVRAHSLLDSPSIHRQPMRDRMQEYLTHISRRLSRFASIKQSVRKPCIDFKMKIMVTQLRDLKKAGYMVKLNKFLDQTSPTFSGLDI